MLQILIRFYLEAGPCASSGHTDAHEVCEAGMQVRTHRSPAYAAGGSSVNSKSSKAMIQVVNSIVACFLVVFLWLLHEFAFEVNTTVLKWMLEGHA